MSKVNQTEIESKIADAWALHRQDDHNGAVRQFENVLQNSPDNIDAHYGIGLAQRANHQLEDAVKSFQRTLELIVSVEAQLGDGIESNIEASQSTYAHSEQMKNVSGDNLINAVSDRYAMLKRMASQRLEETQAILES